MASQFGFMPLCALIMAFGLGVDKITATGMILLASAPGGSTSNLFTKLCGGDLALSITMTTLATLMATFMMPVLILIYVNGIIGATGDVKIPLGSMIMSILLIILPVAVGVVLHRYCTCQCGKYPAWQVFEKFGSGFCMLMLIIIFHSLIKGNPEIFSQASNIAGSWVCGALIQPLGSAFGFGFAKLCKLDTPACIAVSMETGIQNYALVITICALSYTACNRSKGVQFTILTGVCWLPWSSIICLLYKKALKADVAKVQPEEKQILQ